MIFLRYLPRFMLVCIAVLCLASCATTANTEFDAKTDFSQYHTFAWMAPDKHPVQDPVLDSEILDQRVRQASENSLREKGFRPADDKPDFYVTYHTSSKAVLRDVGFRIGIGYGHYDPFWRHSIHSAMPIGADVQERGLLILDVVDARSDRLVWRGWEDSVLAPANFSEAKIKAMVDKILASFPPGPAT